MNLQIHCFHFPEGLPEDYMEGNSVLMSNTVHIKTPTHSDIGELWQYSTLDNFVYAVYYGSLKNFVLCIQLSRMSSYITGWAKTAS